MKLIESDPTSSGSLHNLNLTYIKWKYEIKSRANYTIRKNIFYKWRKLFGWYTNSELFFPFTTTTLTSCFDAFCSSSEKGIFSRIMFSIIISEMKENFLFEWMIDKTSSPEWLWIFEIHRLRLYGKTREDKKKSSLEDLNYIVLNTYIHNLSYICPNISLSMARLTYAIFAITIIKV